MRQAPFIPFHSENPDHETLIARSNSSFKLKNKRRKLRMFSDSLVSKRVIETLTLTASAASSGSHKPFLEITP